MVLRELLAAFGVNTGQAKVALKELDKSIGVTKGALSTLAKTALGAFSTHALKDFLGEQIELGSKLNDTSEKLGLSTDELQKFQFAAGQMGVDADQAAQSLGFLNKNIGEAIAGQKEAVQSFASLGVEIKDGAGNVRELGDIIPDVADAFQKMGSDQERAATAMKLFGRSGQALIPLLKLGSEELREMNKQFDDLGLGIGEDFIKAADEAGDKLDILKLGFRALKTRIALEVLPGITELAKKFSGWVGWAIRASKETNIVKYAWIAMGIAGVVALGKIGASWAKTLGLMKGNAGILRTVFSLGELGLIVAAVALLALAFEDIFTMVEGGESVIGEFLTETLGVQYTTELVNTLRKSFDDLKPVMADLKPLIKDIGVAAGEALPYAIALVVDLTKFVIALGVSLKGIVEVLANVASGIATGDWKPLKRDADKTADRLFGDSGLLSKSTTYDLATKASVPAGSVRQPESFQRGDVSQTNQIEINVQGGQTNEGTGRAVATSLRGVLSGADVKQAAAALARGGEEE